MKWNIKTIRKGQCNKKQEIPKTLYKSHIQENFELLQPSLLTQIFKLKHILIEVSWFSKTYQNIII